MRFLVSILMSVFLSSTAMASTLVAPPSENEGSSGGGGNRFLMLFSSGNDEEEAVEEDEDDPRSFTMPAVVAPLAQNGRLTGFAYVLVRLRVAPGHDVWRVQENTHYALDLMTRSAFRTDLSTEDGQALNRETAVEVWAGALAEYYGADAIESVEIRSFDVRLFSR
ncbi:MAG: hypothetical protein QUV02_00955 [Maricaulis sp.]|jgi:hypothetical protein|uniref:hypothetical protein n=1 Tax=Maricaulis sp. TaxID=1486257 RepID=UPI0026227915|nr:hypothetical protein [Maricaulis sp.]MDM7982988.1 hypothetical protein [Maricaulis sp.]